MRTIILAIALAGLVGSQSSLFAQQATPVSAERLAGARDLLKASGAVDVMIATIRAALPAQKQATPNVPEDFWKRFEARIIEEAPVLADSIATIYARRFTAAELKEMTAFYLSPVGRKLREVQPDIVTESSAVGQRWGGRIGAEIAKSMQQ